LATTTNNSKAASRARWVWLLLGVAVIVLIVFVSRRGPVPVRATTVERGPIRSLVSTNGKIEPVQNFEAHAPIATTVKRLLVKEGDHVRKGQLLLQLDDADIRSQAAKAQALIRAAQADQSALKTGGTHEEVLTIEVQLVKARAARDTAQRNLESFRRLQQQGAASSGEVKQAEDSLQRAQADVTLLEQKQKDRYSQPEVAKVQAQGAEAEAGYQAAEDALAKSNLRAPFEGVVYSLPIKKGAFVQAGDLLLQEADLSHVLVRAFVDEPDIGRLAPGQRGEVTWDAVPGRIWNGAVSAVPSTVRLHGTRNVGEATCVVDNRDFKLLPNINVNVTIITAEHKNALTVLREAVRMDDSKPYVYQIIDGKLKRREVEISLQNLTRVEITAGLAEGALVALGTADSKPLYDGTAVKVVP
jgi:HlyD family secretion protein